HAQAVLRQSPANGPKSLLEAVYGDEQAQANKGGNDDERLDPDRPHFPEASTTVGKDRTVLESGYTFANKGGTLLSHSFPEALLRVGMFTDWFEFRIGQSFLHEEEKTGGVTNVKEWWPGPLPRDEARVDRAEEPVSSDRRDPANDGTDRQ